VAENSEAMNTVGQSSRNTNTESAVASLTNESRRNFLKIAGVAGAVSLAGCSGGTGGGATGSSGSSTTTVTMTGSGSFSLGTAQAMQRALRQESDSVELNVTEVSGNPASVQEYNRGNAASYSTENFTIVSARDGQPPFQSEQGIAPQGLVNMLFHYYWMGVDGSGLETTDDLLEQDVNVWMFPAAWGSRRVQEVIYQNADQWETIQDKVVNLEAGEVAGAIEEGRVDAFFGQGATYEGIPGWATEIDARHDVHVLETSDSLVGGIDSMPSIGTEEIEPYGWEQDVGTETVTAWNNGVQFCFGSDISDEAVYEICRVSHEHPDVLREAMPQYMDHSEPANMIENLLSGVPVHNGAADFLEEMGVWDDSMERA
jgi:TRAP-type uncharacterized transport system substrate-binding protein